MDDLDDRTAVVGMPAPSTTTDHLLAEILMTLQSFQRSRTDQARTRVIKEEWMLVALVLDRFFFFVFSAASVAIGLAIILSHP